MAPFIDQVSAYEAQLERVWRYLNAAWVSASDELAAAESRHAPLLPSEAAYLAALRARARMQRELLEQFERRMREMRSRAAGYRVRYA